MSTVSVKPLSIPASPLMPSRCPELSNLMARFRRMIQALIPCRAATVRSGRVGQHHRSATRHPTSRRVSTREAVQQVQAFDRLASDGLGNGRSHGRIVGDELVFEIDALYDQSHRVSGTTKQVVAL
jgi:hypothetical protein